jgi:hypothetical protein
VHKFGGNRVVECVPQKQLNQECLGVEKLPQHPFSGQATPHYDFGLSSFEEALSGSGSDVFLNCNFVVDELPTECEKSFNRG